MLKCQKCYCPNCEPELLIGCLNPGFCEPCLINRDRTCPVCKSRYLIECSECPVCAIANK